MNEYVVDFGSNLTLLGLIFLGFKFLLPIIFGIVLLYAAWWMLKNKYPELADGTTLLGIIGLIIVILLLLA